MIQYGHEFPDSTHEASVHLYCFRNHDPARMLPRHKHFELAIKALWPEKMPNGQPGFIWSDWAYKACKSFVEEEYQTWWGPAASGKTTMSGVFVLAYWLADPQNTTIMVCSTTREMLERRIWREIVRYHSMLRGRIPGEIYQQPPRLVYESETGKNTISGIFGVAVHQGTSQDAVSRLSGMHNRYNLLVIDEMQGTLQAAVETYDNTSTASLENKFLGMGNPMSRLDPLGKASEPKKGWNTVSPDIEDWETKRGVCLYFDGLKSPGIKDPGKYFFLLQQKDIDQMMKDPGPDSPRFWSQRRGFVPPEGLVETILTESFIHKFHMADRCVWERDVTLVAGLDAAFSAGGDACVFTPIKVGRQLVQDKTGKSVLGPMGIEIQEPVYINLELSSGQPMAFFIADKVFELLKKLKIPIENLAVDITGQQSALADILDQLSQEGSCLRVHASSNASDKKISAEDHRMAKDVYRNKITEMWFRVREYGKHGHIRGLPQDAQQQFCMRQLARKEGRMESKLLLESKEDMKLRTSGRSPDLADSIGLGLEVVRTVLGVLPGDKPQTDMQNMLGVSRVSQKFTLKAEPETMYTDRDEEVRVFFK